MLAKTACAIYSPQLLCGTASNKPSHQHSKVPKPCSGGNSCLLQLQSKSDVLVLLQLGLRSPQQLRHAL